jgi:3-deoxy-D-manno-octulosonic-acid transferase
MASSSIALLAYRFATSALAPAIPFALKARARRGKEDPSRIGERLGYAGRPRPDGQLVWIHGASVGECMAALPLIEELLATEGRHVLLTSGTVSSATLMEERLPVNAFHQYAPVDTPAAIVRFLDHWRPDLALFVDSEIWPNIVSSARARNIPMALINARMSARSFAGWRRLRGMAQAVIGKYDLCLAQDSETAERFSALCATRVQVTGNLKADAPPLPADPAMLGELQNAIGARPVLLAVSTHPGEEETILPAHDRLRGAYPDLLTIIAPRHPARGADIVMLCGSRRSKRRAQDEVPDAGTAIYIADTIGELGLLFRLSSFAFIGGSLVPHGGQNPLEAARLTCAVLAGPCTENFAPTYDAIFAAQGAGRVASAMEIVTLCERLLANPSDTRAMGEAAAGAAKSLGGAVKRTRIAVEELLAHARS